VKMDHWFAHQVALFGVPYYASVALFDLTIRFH
jgi:hypothetical protein